MIDVTNFLKTGEIRDYKVGAPSESIPDIDKYEKYYYNEEEPEYGFQIFTDEIDLTITENELTCISVPIANNHVTILNKFSINVNTQLDKVLDYLYFLDIEWEFNSRHSHGHQLMIELKSGVQITFGFDERYGLFISRIQKYSF